MNVTDLFYASEAVTGYGGQLLVGQDDGSPETFVAIAQVSRIGFGDMTANVINKTHLRSPGRAHEKKATIRDVGAFSFSGQLNMRHGSHNNAGGDGFTSGGLLAMFLAGDERQMRIVRADDAGEIPFRGSVNVYDIGEIGIDNITPLTVEITPLTSFAGDLP